jgi:diguanylate cyclase (GGDEF)-like protein
LERLICALHYPLRNAVLYTVAINSAHKDPLTGIGNRAAMNTALHREIELASRHNRSLGMILIDVDHFKSINDTYGHAAGDYCLQSLMKCAEKSVRISDLLFRYGGEEFVIVLPETDEAGVLRLAKRIRRRVERLETTYQNQLIRMTISLGITTLRDSDDEKTLFTRADEALYQAKQDGRNCIRIAAAGA